MNIIREAGVNLLLLGPLSRLRTECGSREDPRRNADDWQHNIV